MVRFLFRLISCEIYIVHVVIVISSQKMVLESRYFAEHGNIR